MQNNGVVASLCAGVSCAYFLNLKLKSREFSEKEFEEEEDGGVDDDQVEVGCLPLTIGAVVEDAPAATTCGAVVEPETKEIYSNKLN